MEALRIEGFMPFLQGGIVLKSMSHLKIEATQSPWLVPFLPLSHIVMKPGILARTLKNHTVETMQLPELRAEPL